MGRLARIIAVKAIALRAGGDPPPREATAGRKTPGVE